MIYNNIFNKVKNAGGIALILTFLTLSLTACSDFLEEYYDFMREAGYTDMDVLLNGD